MIVCTVSDLGLSFGADEIFRGLTFSVSEGDRVGIIGVNGVGKSSLFRCITGEYTPTSGQVFLAGSTTVGMLAQDTDLSYLGDMTLADYVLSAFPELTALEGEIARTEEALSMADGEEAARLSGALNALHARYDDLGGRTYRARARSLLAKMGFPEPERTVGALSGGQYTRLSLAKLLAREPDLLLLDEPTNHLDIDALTWLEEYLSAYRGTFLVISHDRYFLDRVTNKTFWLRRGGGRLYPGSYSAAKEREAEEEASREHRYREQQKEIGKIRANIEFQRRCGQEHNFVTIRSKEKQLARMDLVAKAAPPERNIRISFATEEASAERVLEVRHLTFSYGAAPLITDLNFLVRRGECVLFLGANGCGKSTLMKLILGRLAPQHGVTELGYNIKIGYYDQENRGLDPAGTVYGEMRRAHPAMPETELRSALALFLFGADDMDKPVSVLSGGEKARLSLAILVKQKVNLLLLDEPTNHLDVGSREALETALAAFPGTILAVSHDRYFISRLATRIIELDRAADGGLWDYPLESYDDAYDAYLALRGKRTEGVVKPVAAPSAEKLRFEAQKREIAGQRAAARKKERAAARAEALEKELAALEEELYGSAASDYVRAAEIDARKGEIEEELLSLYEEIL